MLSRVFIPALLIAAPLASETTPTRPAAVAQLATAPVRVTPVAVGNRAATSFARAGDGLFYVTGRVNGADIRFLVDTGANVVVLTRADAARAGVSPAAFQAKVQTANGPAPMAWTKLDQLSIAGRDVRGVDAGITHTGLGVSLLGQNVLSRLGSVTLTNDSLVVHGDPAP